LACLIFLRDVELGVSATGARANEQSRGQRPNCASISGRRRKRTRAGAAASTRPSAATISATDNASAGAVTARLAPSMRALTSPRRSRLATAARRDVTQIVASGPTGHS